MKFQRQLDPVLGVAEWDDFMDGVEVCTFVPGEPRKEVPGAWIQGAAAAADTESFHDCRAMCAMLMLLYTFCRSETPLPQSHTGENAMDPAKHLRKCDVRIELVGGRLSVGWRLKAIKQDPRMQRDSAQGDGDWVWVGEAEGRLSLVFWIQCYFKFFTGARSGDEPFFVHSVEDTTRAYLYQTCMDHCRGLWSKGAGVSMEQAKTCGLHGLRVAGNNGVTRTLGREMARVQGGWVAGGSQGRYDRFDMAEVVQIPNAIVSSWAQRDSADPLLQRVAPPPPPAAPPAARPAPLPMERAIHLLPAHVRNARRASAPSSSGRGAASAPAASTPQPRKRPRPSATLPRPPLPPPAPKAATVAPRRDSTSSLLSLTRPVRQTAVIDRLPAGVPGDWSSGAA